MKIYGFIFARGGSKGIPNKNLRNICEKSLLARAIESGMSTRMINKIIVSTDSMEIASAAREYGAEVPFMRPAKLATDSSSEWLSWQHAVAYLQDRGDFFDTFVSIPTTAPLREPNDIIRCIQAFQRGDCDLVLTFTKANRSPHFNMLTINAEGLMQVAVPLEKTPVRRQDAPLVYDAATVAYVSSPQHILKAKCLWDGRVRGVEVSKINALDIDEELDLKMAEFFMQHRLEE